MGGQGLGATQVVRASRSLPSAWGRWALVPRTGEKCIPASASLDGLLKCSRLPYLAAPQSGRLTCWGFGGCGKLRGPPLATPTGERGAQTLGGITLQLFGCRGEATGKGLKSLSRKWHERLRWHMQIGLNGHENRAPLQRTGVAPKYPPSKLEKS